MSDVVVHPRSDWTTRAPRSTSSNINPEGCTAHWGGGSPWGSRDFDHDRCASILRTWQSYHMGTNGWVDIAYSAAVCPHGHVYILRGKGVRTAGQGTNDGNNRSYAIVYVAGTGDSLTNDAKHGFIRAAKELGKPLKWVHSDWKPTGCPGDDIRAWRDTGWRLTGSPSQPGSTTPTPKPTPPKTSSNDWKMEIVNSMQTLNFRNVTNNRATWVKGPSVRILQGTLMARGYGPKGLTRSDGKPDGVGGPATRRILGQAQRKYRTGAPSSPGTPDYVAGRGTWRAVLGA